MYDPMNKIKLMVELKKRIMNRGITKSHKVAEAIARRWVTMHIVKIERTAESE